MDRNVATKMDDGALLFADRWYPTGSTTIDPPPIVLLRSPYGRHELGIVGQLFAERGYQAVIQSCRGTFRSGGQWEPLRNEQADGLATLRWMAEQPWFGGRVATFGPSYLGLTQWAVAEDAPEFVRAMSLSVTASNFREAVIYPSGVFSLQCALAWLHQLEHQEAGMRRAARARRESPPVVERAARVVPVSNADAAAVGHRVEFFQEWIAHERPDDPWWSAIDFSGAIPRMPPSTLVGGWYDMFLPAQIADYRALRDAGRTAHLTIGPWFHAQLGGMAAVLRDGLRWFDRHLRENGGQPSAPAGPAGPGGPGGPAGASRAGDDSGVTVFVMGGRRRLGGARAAGRWVELPDWPPPAEEQRWFLAKGGRLQRSEPGEAPPDRYCFDPEDPTPVIGGTSLINKCAGRKDQRATEARPDVLTYTSPPLAEDLTVIGPISAELHVRSSLEHSDFFVRLCDVDSAGRSWNLCDGILRLPQPDPGAAVPGSDGTTRLTVTLWPTANTFARGHRIRVQVASGAFPLYAPNHGTGEPLASAIKMLPADQEVFCDSAHPSAVRLPVVRSV